MKSKKQMTNETPENSVQTEAFKAQEQTWRHIDLVMRLLMSAQIELMRRAVTHDRTKLISPEREMFAEMTSKLRGLTYGSPEYKECLEQMKGQALGHHYSHNRHHPEFFNERNISSDISDYRDIVRRWLVHNWLGHDFDMIEYQKVDCQRVVDFLDTKQAEHQSSVNRMNLFDLIEMFVDWTAACQRHADGDINKSIEVNTARFALSPQLVEIFKNTVSWVQDGFVGLTINKTFSRQQLSCCGM
jgi:hypothetical protein